MKIKRCKKVKAIVKLNESEVKWMMTMTQNCYTGDESLKEAGYRVKMFQTLKQMKDLENG